MREPSALERLRALEERERRPAQHAATAPRSRVGGIAGAVGVAALLLLKFAGKLKLVGLVAKLGKFATTGWSMALMAWAYSYFYGWPFAAGLVLLILVHEIGHGIAAARLGLQVGVPVFIPFFGAFIALKEQPRSTFDDAVIGAGGPFFGTAGALACLALFLVVPGAEVLLAVAYFALVINLFNLMPVWNLDGARMLSPVPPHLGAAALGLLAVVFAWMIVVTGHANPIGLLVVLVATWQVGARFVRARRAGPSSTLGRMEAILEASRQVPDDGVTPRQRAIAAGTWLGIALVLVVTAALLHERLPQVN